MKPRLVLCLALAAGCGDDSSSTIDAPTAIDAAPVIDSSPVVDAPVCDLTGYPPPVRAVSIQQNQPTTLTLDGTGARCDQIVRALSGPGRPPELAQLDVTGITRSSCQHDDVTNREIVRMYAGNYAGVPLYGRVQDVLAHVDASNTVVFLAGDYLASGQAPGPGCLTAELVGASVPGRALGYQRFAACVPGDPGEYTIAADDTVEVLDEGLFVDGDGALHRVRAVDVYLAPSHVDADIGNSDAYCCTGKSGVDHCVGQRLFIDTYSGTTLGQEPHCHTC